MLDKNATGQLHKTQSGRVVYLRSSELLLNLFKHFKLLDRLKHRKSSQAPHLLFSRSLSCCTVANGRGSISLHEGRSRHSRAISSPCFPCLRSVSSVFKIFAFAQRSQSPSQRTETKILIRVYPRSSAVKFLSLVDITRRRKVFFEF